MLSPILANAPINGLLFVVHFHTHTFLEEGAATEWKPLTRQFMAGATHTGAAAATHTHRHAQRHSQSHTRAFESLLARAQAAYPGCPKW